MKGPFCKEKMWAPLDLSDKPVHRLSESWVQLEDSQHLKTESKLEKLWELYFWMLHGIKLSHKTQISFKSGGDGEWGEELPLVKKKQG